MMTPSKNSDEFDYYFSSSWKVLCSTTLMQTFTTRLNWFRTYDGYFMSEKPRLVRVKVEFLKLNFFFVYVFYYWEIVLWLVCITFRTICRMEGGSTFHNANPWFGYPSFLWERWTLFVSLRVRVSNKFKKGLDLFKIWGWQYFFGLNLPRLTFLHLQ